MKSNIPWSPGSRNLRIDAWCVVLMASVAKAPERKRDWQWRSGGVS